MLLHRFSPSPSCFLPGSYGRKRKPSLSGSEVPTTTFADVAGMESAKRELAEVGSPVGTVGRRAAVRGGTWL